MADIELVIKMPEKTINEIKDNAMFAGSISSDVRWDVTSAIVNGTPLPKGHGNLVDYEELKNNAMEYGAYAETTLSHIKPKTIIEAYKEQEDRNDD